MHSSLASVSNAVINAADDARSPFDWFAKITGEISIEFKSAGESGLARHAVTAPGFVRTSKTCPARLSRTTCPGVVIVQMRQQLQSAVQPLPLPVQTPHSTVVGVGSRYRLQRHRRLRLRRLPFHENVPNAAKLDSSRIQQNNEFFSQKIYVICQQTSMFLVFLIKKSRKQATSNSQ
uniref:Uncharacterized protein n=1 Tax=Spongospora subterranea TaxID=70186 RepID=A0A0H5QXA0_9EUKA|eukprot:CRZ06241.1 hypothetical protein [Spongospora subterranea]